MPINTTQALVKALTESYGESLSQHTSNRITAPILVVYSGKNAAHYDQHIMSSFRQVWLTARAEHICRATRQGDTLVPIKSGKTNVHEYVDEMYQCEDTVFEKFNKLTLVAIYDSRDYASADELIGDYECDADNLAKEFEMHRTTVVRMIIIEHSKETLELEKSLRKYFAEKRDEEKRANPACAGTFVFSNSLNSGKQKPYEQIYDLIGNLIVVGCNNSSFNSTLDVFGAYDKNTTFRTVSYTKMERPNSAICETIVKRTIEQLESYFADQPILDDRTVKDKLGLTESGLSVATQVYDKIKNNLPPLNVLEHLPMNTSVKGIGIANMQFSEFSEAAMGSFEFFYKKYYLPVINNGSTEEIAASAVRSQLKEKFTLPEIMQLNSTMIDRIGDWLQNVVENVPAGLTVSRHIEKMNVIAVERVVAKVIPIEIEKQKKLAQEQMSVVKNISADFRQNVILSDQNVAEYYDGKVHDYLRQLGNRFFSEVLHESANPASVLERIYTVATKMIESDARFKLAFEDELKARTNDESGIYNYIRTHITDNTSKNIFFNAAVTTPQPLFRVILMNQKKSSDRNADTDLFKEMKQNLFSTDDDYFIDNGNLNGVLALQICTLPSDSMLL